MSITKDKILSGLVAILVLSMVFSFLGVYDTDTMSFLQRLFLWSTTLSVGTVMGLCFIPWVFNGPLRDKNIALRLTMLSAIAALPVVLVLAAFSGGFTDQWSWFNWPLQYFLSFTIAMIINIGGHISMKAAGWLPNSPKTPKQEVPLLKQFLQRLPVKYHTAELYAVSSEDHYICVHTNVGEELILMRLADAIKELGSTDGLQTHRSWWVARNGIAESISKNGKHSFLLKTGTNVPISRSFLNVVKDANLL